MVGDINWMIHQIFLFRKWIRKRSNIHASILKDAWKTTGPRQRVQRSPSLRSKFFHGGFSADPVLVNQGNLKTSSLMIHFLMIRLIRFHSRTYFLNLVWWFMLLLSNLIQEGTYEKDKQRSSYRDKPFVLKQLQRKARFFVHHLQVAVMWEAPNRGGMQQRPHPPQHSAPKTENSWRNL